MTNPDERTRAVTAARNFMRDLVCPSITPKVPKAIRERAHSVLRHYPWNSDIFRAAAAVPEVFAEPRKYTNEVYL